MAPRAAPKKKLAKAKTKKKKAVPRKAAPLRRSSGQAPKKSPLAGTPVDAYVRNLPSPQQMIITRLRALVRDTAPEAVESLKWAQPVYEVNGPVAYIKANAQHVNFGFWRGAMLEAPEGLLEGDGDRMRHLKIFSLADIKADILKTLVRQAVLLNVREGNPTRRGSKS